ncbi:unnamed protein product, partial [marine sediment metagenome]
MDYLTKLQLKWEHYDNAKFGIWLTTFCSKLE